jgi:hypothetical protein
MPNMIVSAERPLHACPDSLCVNPSMTPAAKLRGVERCSHQNVAGRERTLCEPQNIEPSRPAFRPSPHELRREPLNDNSVNHLQAAAFTITD